MKNILLTVFTLFFGLQISAQEIVGQWSGVLKLPGTELHVVFNVSKNDKGGFTSTMDSPDQGVNGIPVTITTFVDNTITFEITAMTVKYSGTL